MDTNSRASQADMCASPKRNAAADSSSKEKKILQGRRQQRHSTEIGSEYHRWWVVRSALGFETNEHIAGLLLDGFHGLLQHLVVMCGGEMYQTEPKLPEANDCCEEVAQSPSSSSSASPPGGIENMGEFLEYRNAISHYCDSLWRLCCQQGSQLQQLDKTSQPVQEFLIRLMGYLRAAKGKSFSLNPKKKRFKSNSMCARSLGEGNLFHVNLPKLCPLGTHHESRPADTASTSNPPVSQCITGSVTDDHQAAVETSSFCLEPGTVGVKQTGESHEKTDNTLQGSAQPESSATEKCLYNDPSLNLPDQHSEKKEQTDVEPKMSQPCFRHLQTAAGRDYKALEFQQNHQVSEQSSRQVQETEEEQPLNLSSPHCLHSSVSQQQTLPGLESPQRFAKTPLQWDTSLLNTQTPNKWDTSLHNTQTSNTTCCPQKDPMKKDEEQQTQRSLSQGTNSEKNKPFNVSEKKKLGHWWSHDSFSPATSCRGDAGLTGLSTCNVSGNVSDTAGTNNKSAGEFGFLLTDALKILPCIDEETSDLPAPLCPEKNNIHVKKQFCDFKINSDLALTSGRQVQGHQASSLTSVPSEQTLACVAGIGGAQSLLANTQPPLQRVQETQTVATSGSLYSEIKLNASNTWHAGDRKSHSLVSNASFQAAQPAALEKSSPISLGTPVILYPASTFPSNDNSLASLSSLVQNIVYNSFGTSIRPLSLAPISSRSVVGNPPLLPPVSVATFDSGSQKKSIAAALPVLSSQLSSARPAILPFYISHTADGNMPKFTNPLGLSKASSQSWTHALTTTDSQVNFGQSQSQNPALFTHHIQPSIPGFVFTNRQPISNYTPIALVKTTGVCSGSDTEFPEVYQARNETTFSPTLASNRVKAKDPDKNKIKSDDPVPYLCQAQLLKHVVKADKKHDLQTRRICSPATETTVTAAIVCDQTEQPTTSCDIKEKPTSCVTYSGNVRTNCHMAEADNKQEASMVVLPGAILNSLLATKAVNCSWKNCIEGHKNKIAENDLSDVVIKTDDVTDSHADNTINVASSLQEEHQQQHSGIKSLSKAKRRVKDATSTLKNKPPGVASSSKSSQRRQLMCRVCGTTLSSCMDLLVHRLEQHGHVCGECDSRFLTLSRLQQHKDTDHPLMLICSQCQFHTFSRSDLLEHVWSVHGISMNEADSSKSETHCCDGVDSSFTEAFCDARNTINSSVIDTPEDAEVVAEKPIKDWSTKVSETTRDVCLEKQEHVCIREEHTLARTGELADTIDQHVDKGQLYVGAPENLHASKLSLSKSEFLTDLVFTDAQKASSGPVFPSLSRQVSEVMRSDLDTMSAMFAQVSQYCQLDSADFLNLSDNPASESEEPRLVIDTDVSCDKDAGMNGRERRRDKIAARSQKTKPASLVRSSKTKPASLVGSSRTNDKSNSRSFRKRKPSPLTATRSYSPAEQEGVCGKKTYPNNFSDVCKTEHDKEEGMDVSSGKGKERERLIMSISLKRQDITSVYKNGSRGKRKRRNSKSVADSSTDVDLVEESHTENLYAPKNDLSKNHTFCDDVPESSCDQISSSSDNLDKHAKYSTMLMDAPKRDSFFRWRDNINPSSQPLDQMEPLKIYLAKDAVDGPRSLNSKSSSKLRDVVNSGATDSPSERALSLRERHIMFSLPPKKRKLKKSLRARDVSSTLDAESEVSNSLKPRGIDTSTGAVKPHGIDTSTGAVKQSSFSRAAVGLSEQADHKKKTKYDVTEENKVKVWCRGDKDAISMSACPEVSLSNVKSNPRENEPLKAEENQKLKFNGGSFVGGCKGQLFHRWSMKEHRKRPQAKRPEISCSVSGCEVKCLNKRELRQHITVEHLGKTRKYMCSWPDCSKGFFARTHLSIHMLTHTGEKPVACDVCDYRCRQRTALIWHLRKHGVFHKTVKVKTRRNSTAS